MIFEVTDKQIERLNDSDLRTLVAFLCAQTLRTQGHSPAAVTAGGNQNAKDGGIDVRVELPAGTAVSGYVPAAATGLQVKAQDMPRASVIEEMVPDGVLRPSIEDLARRGGAYIIVSSKGSLADTALKDRRAAMREAVGSELAVRIHLDFYDRHRLEMWVNEHPALIPWVHERVGQPLAGWRPFHDWSSSPTDVDKPYFLDDHVRLLRSSADNQEGVPAADGINSLREMLAKPGGVVRLVGLSGVGKTRLIQALFDERLGNNSLNPQDAIYTDISDSPNPVPMELASRLIILRHRAILIVDNCGPDLHQKLTAKVCEGNSQLSLITVEYDINDDEPERTNVFKLEVASVELIEKILEARFPNIAPPSRRVIAEFSDGNARIAFALASTAQNGDSIEHLRDTELFKRLFDQSKGPNEGLLNAAKVCALVYSFDGTLEADDAELSVLAGSIGITPDQLYAAVSELMRRKLVQTRGKWRAILPHAVAHRLAKIALEDIPISKIEDAVIGRKDPRMLRSFSKRLGYMHQVPVVRDLVAKWLGKDGFLDSLGTLNELGEAMLTNIAPVDPALTLRYIEAAAATSDGFFENTNRNRDVIVRLLRSIAYDAALFDRTVSLIRKFAQKMEKGNNAGSAPNVLQSLFYIYLSGTHATPAQRLAFIRPHLESDEKEAQECGIELLKTMLECTHFTSSHSFDFGARSRDYGSNPRGAEVQVWFGQILEVCRTFGLSARPIATPVRRMIASRIGDIVFRAGLLDDVVALAHEFSGETGWPEGWVGVRSAIFRWKKNASPESIQKLEELAEFLRPTELPALVRAYALSKEWSTLDVAESEEDSSDDPSAAHARIFEMCVELGKELAKQPETLAALLPEIFASRAMKTSALGRGIAAVCQSPRDMWAYLSGEFLKAPEQARSWGVLGGFIEEMKSRDREVSEAALDDALANPRLHPYLLNLQAYAGLNSRSLPRLMAALELETVPTMSFQILEMGRLHEGFNDAEFSSFILKLCDRPDGLPVAVEILGMRVFSVKPSDPPVSDAIKVLGREVLSRVKFEPKGAHHEFSLAQLIQASLKCPEDYALASTLCTRIKEALADYKINSFDVSETIKALAKSCPSAVLDTLVEDADKHLISTMFRDIREGRRDPLAEMTEDAFFNWAAEKPDTRYAALAGVIRFSDRNEDDASSHWSPTAEKIISLAPNATTVLDSFFRRFDPMSWTGSRADIMASRIPLIQALGKHARPEVSAWAAKAQPEYEARVAQEREKEAVRDKLRDERFE